MMDPKCDLLVLVGTFLCAATVCAQTVIFDQKFDDSTVDDDVWEVFRTEGSSVDVRDGRLSVKSFGAKPAGLLTRSDRFPLFQRPSDESEYDVYFLGVRLQDQRQAAAFGLCSLASEQTAGSDAIRRLPTDYHDSERVSYSFAVSAHDESPGRHWVSTMLPANAGAAADSTGPDGFHTWEYGKIYDFRIQITRHDTTWWGRVSPHEDWMLLQDPALDIGYNGSESGGRDQFGIFVSATNAGLALERIYVTHYVPVAMGTLLDEEFDGDHLAWEEWSPVVPETGVDRVHVDDGRLRVVSRDKGSNWAKGAGIWTPPTQFPLFERPADSSKRVYVDFLDVALPAESQRCALGLYSTDPMEPGECKFPDDHGPGGGLAYFFWVLPDNDRLVENSNQLRAAVINEKYAATDNYHHVWIWPYTERRDLRIEVTNSDVRWYVRKHADTAWRVLRDSTEHFYRRPAIAEDRSVGYWRPLYDPGVLTSTSFDGSEAHGRSRFGVFAHVSSAGSEGAVSWQDGMLTIGSIQVTAVTHID